MSDTALQDAPPSQEISIAAPTNSHLPWPVPLRTAFRFIFAYLVLYLFPAPLDVLPGSDFFIKPYTDVWNAFVLWVGQRVFHITITIRPNGSGDTTYNYVQIFCFAMLALMTTLVWTLLDRNGKRDPRLFEGLRVYVRLCLATALITYGAIKVFPSQFPAPALSRLVEPFGDASPMGLLWTFMGASPAYNAFAGCAEMLGGLLLTSRRTTLLGALVSIGVMTNVVMLNFCYDVPVKLFSLHLLILAVFLTLPALGRLVDFFLLGRPIGPTVITPRFRNLLLNRALVVLKTLAVIVFAGTSLIGAYNDTHNDARFATVTPMYGIWNVETFAIDCVIASETAANPVRWKRVIFSSPGAVAIQGMDDTSRRYVLDSNVAAHKFTLTKHDVPDWKSVLSYTRNGDTMTLDGMYDGHHVHALLHHESAPRFLLLHRGFHWINEHSYNR